MIAQRFQTETICFTLTRDEYVGWSSKAEAVHQWAFNNGYGNLECRWYPNYDRVEVRYKKFGDREDCEIDI